MSKVIRPVENKSGHSFRLRKAESLDWKKIASLDVEKIIQETDEETLKEILPQIAFCQPDVEFDHNRTDPGFRKVFRLGQLIIEHLIQSHETTLERATLAESGYSSTLQKNKEHEEEIQRLRERLVDARKELKRRKEMIESNQVEIMGGPQNKDEYDQCPYCSKKFINSIYLFSHLQRRHQGLPLHPAFPSGPTGLPPSTQGQGQGQWSPNTIRERVTTFTQTDEEEEEGIWKSSGIDHKTLNHLIEKHLTERLGSSILPAPAASSNSIQILPQHPPASSHPDIISGENERKTIARMKEEMETQWRVLIEKIHKTELEDLKRTLVGEMQKMQEIMSKSGTRVEGSVTPRRSPSDVIPEKSSSPPVSLVGRVEERFQKQETELETLKLNLQTRIRADMEVIESRLESQERFWRAKLRTVESEYQKHIGNLREEFQQTILNTGHHHPEVQQEEGEVEVIPKQRSPTKVKWPPADALVTVKPPTAPTSSSAETIFEENPNDDEEIETSRSPPPPPVPKPRSKLVKVAEESEVKVTGLPPKVPKEIRSAKKSKTIPVRPTTAVVVVEPKDAERSPSSSEEDLSTSDEESDSIGTYSPTASRPHQNSKPETGVKVSQKGQKFGERTVVDYNLNVTESGPKGEALQELSNQLKELGLSPQATTLHKKGMKKSLKQMKRRRMKLSEEMAAEREIQKEETRVATVTKMLETKAATATGDSRRLSSLKPIPPPSKSPLVKIFAAVRSGGTTLRRKMSSMTTSNKKTKLSKTMSPRNRPKPVSNVTTPSRAGPSRKSAPPPPTATTTLKKQPKLKSIFRRSVTKGKEESSETDEGSPIRMRLPLDPQPIRFSPAPPTKTTNLSPTKGVSGSPKGQVSWFEGEGPDEESQVITARKLDIQRKAEKEIKLSRVNGKGVGSRLPETPDKKRPITRRVSSESGSDDDGVEDEKRKGLYSSSARNGADLTFDPSLSSVGSLSATIGSTTSSDSAEEEETSVHGKRNKSVSEDEEEDKEVPDFDSPKRAPGKVTTVIHHDPMRGLDEFGMRLRSPRPKPPGFDWDDEKSSLASPPPITRGVKSRNQGWSSPPAAGSGKVTELKSPQRVKDVSKGSQSGQSKWSPSSPPKWSIAGPHSKHRDNSENSWDK